jgi:Tfp pilus assembly protein PilN
VTIDINLIPLKTRQQKWGKPIAIVGSLLFVVILAGLLFLYLDKLHEKNQARLTLSDKQTLLQRLNADDTTHSAERLILQSKVAQLKKGSTHVQTLLMVLLSLLPRNSTLTNFDYQGNVITVSGQFKGLDEVAGFEHAMESNSLFSNVTLNKVEKSSTSFYSADFTVQVNESAYQVLGGGHS